MRASPVQWLGLMSFMVFGRGVTAVPATQPAAPAATADLGPLLIDTTSTFMYPGVATSTPGINPDEILKLQSMATATGSLDVGVFTSLLNEITEATTLPTSVLSQLTAALASATSTSTPAAEKPKNETPALVGGIVAAVLVVGASVGGAYYWYRRRQKREQEMGSSQTKLVPSITTSTTTNPSTYFEQKYARSALTPSPSYTSPYATPMHSPNPIQQNFPWSPSKATYDTTRSTSAFTSHTNPSERHASTFTQSTMARSEIYGFDQPGEDIPIAFDVGRPPVKWNEAYVPGGSISRSQTPDTILPSNVNHAVELESRTWTPPPPPKDPDSIRTTSPGPQMRSHTASPAPQREVRRRISSSVYTASVYSTHESVYELDANPPSLPSTSVLAKLVKETLSE